MMLHFMLNSTSSTCYGYAKLAGGHWPLEDTLESRLSGLKTPKIIPGGGLAMAGESTWALLLRIKSPVTSILG